MSLLNSSPSMRRRKRLALSSSAALAIMAIPMIVGGQASAGAPLTPLTVTPNSDSVTYGDAEPSYTYNITGFVNGEDEGTAAGYTPPTCDSDYDAGDPVGPYTITCTGGSATDYSFDTTATASLTVNAPLLTVVPNNDSITYGDAEPIYDFTVTGFVNGEDEGTADGYSAPTCDSDYDQYDAVGPYTITCSGGSATNYTFDTTATATLTVAEALLTVTPANDSIKYGDLEPTYNFSVTGFVNGEDEGTADGYGAPTCDSDYDQFDAAGPYTITCTGGSATNYTFDTTASATLTVAEALLTVTPSDMTLNYGAPEPTFDFDVTGFVGSESEINATGYFGPNCDSDYDAGDPVGTYTITCSGGSATDYTFDTASTATLTIVPFVLGEEEVVYSGQTEAKTRSASDTSSRVTLSASITADFDNVDEANSCTEGGPSVSDATATFRDLISGRVIATGVPIAEVGGNCEEGIATIFATLSTGQNGTEMYLIEVTIDGSFSGDNDFQIGNAPETTSVTVSLPATTGTFIASGDLPYVAGSSYYVLGTEGSLTGAMDSEDVVATGYRFVPGTRKVTPKGQATLLIPAPNGGVYYVKTNSITSMTVGTNVTTVFAKASITLIGGDCETTCGIDGNVSLRLDVKNTGEIGYTIQSSKTSVLYYSNDWYKDGRVWKTMPQTLLV